MWRQNVFRETPDSDLSISDEEDFDSNLPNRCDKKEELQLPSRLEMLRGTLEWDCEGKTSNLSKEKETNVSLEDDVEMPEFHNEGDFTCSLRKAFTCNLDEEIISDDEENNVLSTFSATSGTKKFHKDCLQSFRSGKQDGPQTWFAVSKEVDELIHLNKNPPCSSSHSAPFIANKSFKGARCKAKQKFPFSFQSHKEGPCCPSISKNENDVSFKDHETPKRLDPIKPRSEEHSIAKVLEDCQEENEIQSEIVLAEVGALGYGCVERSMAELLDGLQDRASLPKGVSKMCSRTRSKRGQIVAKRSVSSLGDRTVESEDSPESMGSGSSSEDEMLKQAKDQKLKVTIPEMKGQTMADRFQEAVGATFLNNEVAIVAVPKPSGIGLFGKLQQLMQTEKERDMDFLRKLETGSNANDETSCIVVKILTRYLDAKLTVCQCSFGQNMESGSPQIMVEGGRKRTIIFSPRVSSDVDLDVGNLICIHPPWKEVQVGNDESILLSTYFSQILI
ncbi:uncharacterized protein LOC132171589 isoform X2 [Corylus avellana]|uniref:uncharacterized protein LOC132171589 isoform X2 n=2 Tax=Corylus avellana TaxID=13451 RepID=UPI00286BBD0C|nr:uncharacterized protein LOC132171589 isoform X2 [Corylus avellana]